MARPVKIGLDYFPLDIDIFDDEKVIPISSEFGAKGECVIIRVLCAIYRNGYFAECSDAFMFKIAKQANLPHTLVKEVILGLVKWGFFDKSVFDSFEVLTSVGIQKRWKEATRKRVQMENLEFWLLDDEKVQMENLEFWLLDDEKVSSDRNYPKIDINNKNNEFLPPETTVNQTETTQSKVKESKVNIKEKENTEKEKPHRFFPPSLEEVKEFISEKKYTVDAEAFVAFYTSKNWFVGKNKMKDWRAAVVTWEKRKPNQKGSNYLNVNDIWGK